jgi:hypothetical protein
MMVFSAVVIDEAAEPDPADGRRRKEDARHYSGRQYRLGPQEHPEGNCEPNREADDRQEQRVHQQVDECAIRALAEVEHTCLGRGHEKGAPVSRSHGLDLPRLPDASAPS